MKNNSLSEKLILYFVSLGIVAIMIISTFTFYSTKKALMSRTFDQLTSLRIVKKNQIDQFYADRQRDILFLAGTEEVNHSSLVGEGPGVGRSRGIATKYHQLGQYFKSFFILGNKGLITRGCFNDTIYPGLPVFPEKAIADLRTSLIHQQVVIGDESLAEQTGHPYQFIATGIAGPVTGDHSDRAILVLEVSIDAINTIMLNNDPLSGLGLSGETYLVGTDFLMRSTSRFQPRSILKTIVRTQPVSEALSGRQGAITTNDYRNIPVFSSYDRITVPGLTWAILAEIDVQEAMVPIYETRTRILLLSTIIIIFFFVLVYFISTQITKPLIRLKNATINLGEGQHNTDLPVTTRDEIGALTESFNIMVRQIREKNTELQQERLGRMRSVIDGEEMERQRLSLELHDGIGQLLIAIRLRIENLLYQDEKGIPNSIQELKKYLDQVIDEVRRISNNLMPSVLEAFGIAIALRNLISETEENSGLRINFETNGDFDGLDRKIKTYIYRLTQEALHNIVKHAEAREVWIILTRNDDKLMLVIRDDGRGFTPETAGKDGGNGIYNMRERTNLLQGQIAIHSSTGEGTAITINIPISMSYVNN